ncbi:MAG: hypothetical protein ACTSYB_14770 [Candidatus Helarchaeota archaeon]
MPCDICGADEVSAKCIVCEKNLCSSCVHNCDLQGKDVCVQKAGDFVIYRCPGTHCPTCAIESLIFTCKDCGIKFCRTVIDEWAKPCPTCKDYICGFCYEEHIKTCTDYYDKEEALSKLYKLIEGDKEKDKKS